MNHKWLWIRLMAGRCLGAPANANVQASREFNELASNGLEWIPRRAKGRARAPSANDDQLPNRYASETKQLFPAGRQRFLYGSECHLWARCVLASSFPCPFKENCREAQGLPGKTFPRTLHAGRLPPTQPEHRPLETANRQSSLGEQVDDLS